MTIRESKIGKEIEDVAIEKHKKGYRLPTPRNEAQTPLRRDKTLHMGREIGSGSVGEERLRKPGPDRGRRTQSERSQNTC